MGRESRRLNRMRALSKQMRMGKPPVLRYYGELLNDDYIKRLIVLNGHLDPTMVVESETADGIYQKWLRIEEEGRTVFLAPDGYMGGPIGFVHDKDLISEAMTFESEKTFSFNPQRETT